MCGIAGIISTSHPREVRTALRAMLAAQAHRGPDDCGTEVIDLGDACVGLGNRRLAILDLSPLGRQPMVNLDTNDVLVHNGEIYNCPELRSELEGKGYCFKGRSDTEVVLRAYEAWGVNCLARLKGMFAFAIWDTKRRCLFVARDHLGIKPLYYVNSSDGAFLFASELRALLASGIVPDSIDRRALAGYLAYGAVQEPLTIVEGVRALAPGSWMEINDSGALRKAGVYWDLPQPLRQDGVYPDSQVEEGRGLLERAVARHLLSDVPVGVFLSSGLDSTAVLGMVQKAASGDVHAFNVSFPDQAYADESRVARGTAQRLDVTYHEYPIDHSTTLRFILDGLDSVDQPTMDGLNTYMVSRAVHEQNISVALSGLGGDELFGGYPSFRKVPQWAGWMRWLGLFPRDYRKFLVGLATVGRDQTFRGKAQDVAETGDDLLGLYFQSRRLLCNKDLESLGLNASSLDLTATFHAEAWSGSAAAMHEDPVGGVRQLETIFYLRNVLLRDTDVFGMANSLEVRVPFLDKDLVEWAFRLPGGRILPEGEPAKYLLRQMCSQFYSLEQTIQKKKGFRLPLDSWLKGTLRDLMETGLECLRTSNLVRSRGIENVRAGFLHRPDSEAWSRVWGLTVLGHWLERRRQGEWGRGDKVTGVTR